MFYEQWGLFFENLKDTMVFGNQFRYFRTIFQKSKRSRMLGLARGLYEDHLVLIRKILIFF